MGDSIIRLEDIIWLAATTVIAGYQMSRFARKVGNSRQKFKINPPAVDGDPEFIRTFRAQQNCLEFFTMFLSIMWMAGLFFHQVTAAILGLVYCYGRSVYFDGYVRDAKERVPGFKICVRALTLLLVLAMVGLIQTILVTYAKINLKQMIMDGIGHGEL